VVSNDTPAPSPSAHEIADDGPHRLVIVVEETTDEGADLRRVRRICAALDEQPGDLPVEMRIQHRDQRVSRMRRGAVNEAALADLTPRLRALLGVLGTAREVGAVEKARSTQLVAIGGR
jgi:hypothetical protein